MSKNKITWHTEKRKLNQLKGYEFNPRSLSEVEYSDLKKSLEKFDLAEIPAINTNNIIVAGHQRIKILSELYGVEHTIEVRVPNRKLTDKEYQEYNIRSNKNTGSWDFDILANNFEKEDLIDWGFNKEQLGMIDEINFPLLKDGDREPFQQMTFTLADKQAKILSKCITEIKTSEVYTKIEKFGNENSNGNALYFIVNEWAEQKK